MTRVLLTGAAGLVGSQVARTTPAGVDLTASTRADLDLSRRDDVLAAMRRLRPDVVVHTACRMDALASDVVDASTHVVDGCLATGAALVHVSSDVVFDGDAGPYDERSRPAPISPYGEAKAAVEADIAARLPDAAVVRTSLVCSTDPVDPRSQGVIDALRDDRPITLFTDELRCPVRIDDLAACVWELALVGDARAGVWHVVGPEALSRYALGVLVAAWAGVGPAGITAGRSTDHPDLRPRDVRLLDRITSARLATPRRPVSTLFAPSRPVA